MSEVYARYEKLQAYIDKINRGLGADKAKIRLLSPSDVFCQLGETTVTANDVLEKVHFSSNSGSSGPNNINIAKIALFRVKDGLREYLTHESDPAILQNWYDDYQENSAAGVEFYSIERTVDVFDWAEV